jgi:predicted nuclease of predicted toxin-antitoxin system
VKLPFDENLSPKLVAHLAADFPESVHVSRVELDQADDETVWAFARKNALTIVPKDADFQEISLRLGMAPKLVWLQRGNCSVDETSAMLRDNVNGVRAFLGDSRSAALVVA